MPERDKAVHCVVGQTVFNPNTNTVDAASLTWMQSQLGGSQTIASATRSGQVTSLIMSDDDASFHVVHLPAGQDVIVDHALPQEGGGEGGGEGDGDG